MKNRYLITLGTVSILTGLVLSAPIVLPQLFATSETTASATSVASAPVTTDTPLISGAPSHIAFPAQDISVDVIPGYYNQQKNSWTLTSDKAQWASVTSEANNKTGNTFIYGHNRWQVFTGLLQARAGDLAVVTTNNGHTFAYTLIAIKDTDPTDLSYMHSTVAPTLTVQTCSGIWYEHRRMLTFQLSTVDGKEVR